ncbi:disulfide bond formation protein DsbB [Paraburkholderia sp. MM5482-R2]
MELLGRLCRAQRMGLFVGAVIAVLAVLAHNPFNGYVTEVAWTVPPGPQCPRPTEAEVRAMSDAELMRNLELTKKYCGGLESRDLDFSLWRSADPFISWLGWVTHFIAFQCAVVLLTILWVALSRESRHPSDRT